MKITDIADAFEKSIKETKMVGLLSIHFEGSICTRWIGKPNEGVDQHFRIEITPWDAKK